MMNSFERRNKIVDLVQQNGSILVSDLSNSFGISEVTIRADLRLLEEKQVEAYYFPSFAEIEDFLREKCMNGDLLITMGAGNVVNIGEDLLK